MGTQQATARDWQSAAARRGLGGLTLTLALTLCCPAWARGHLHGRSPHGGGMGALAAAVNSYNAQYAAWARREAIAETIRRAKNNEHRMFYAARARTDGKMRLAATLYLRVALQRPKDKHAGAAKKALLEMATEGRAEMKAADTLLSQDKIAEAFEKIDYLAWAYVDVPRFNEEIAAHATKLHHEPRYQAVLNEPKAQALVEQAEQHEQDHEQCCAYLAYEEAAKLVPAKSAKKAAARLAEMRKDPRIAIDAEECRQIMTGLHRFQSAELLKKSTPGRAEEIFAQIVEKTPRDSEVHRCAADELAKLRAPKRRPPAEP
jgi:hypothetical protein